MIIDLIHAEISYECESNTDGVHSSRGVQPIRHLTNEKWVIVLAAEGHEVSNDNFTDNQFYSTIRARIELHSDNDI